jgi:hypothetical protein
MAICYGTFQIKRPANLNKAGYAEYITVQGVWAQEITPGIDEKDLIDWKLLTTHCINNITDALQMVEWYSARWYNRAGISVTETRGLWYRRRPVRNGLGITQADIDAAFQLAEDTPNEYCIQ